MLSVPAAHFTKHVSRTITQIVIHDPECGERPDSAENVAKWVFSGPNAVKASAHVVVDCDSAVRCVEDHDEAWHANEANPYSLGIEIAGMAVQTAEQWLDTYSRAALEQAAQVCADWCRLYDIPVQHCDGGPNDKGLTGHVDVNKAHHRIGGHWDPGPNFPWGYFLDRIMALMKPAPIALAPVTASEWVRVIDASGQAWDVSPRMIGPLGIGEAIALVKSKGLDIPTPELSDACFHCSDLKLAPMPRNFTTWTGAEMAAPAVVADQKAKIEEAIGSSAYTLVSGEYKDIVTRGGQVGLYGWHLPSGQPIQPFYAGHSYSWKDYSQGLRLARKVTSP